MKSHEPPAGPSCPRRRRGPVGAGRPAPARRAAAALAVALLAGSGLAACGSSSTNTAASASASASLLGSTRQQDCTAVADTLADGPDPDADAVGYAEAQVLPLQQLKLTDPAVRAAVGTLDSAFKAVADAQNQSQTVQKQDAAAVSSAQDALNKLCPGAAS